MLVIWRKDKFERIFDELFLVDEHKYTHEYFGLNKNASSPFCFV